MQVVDSRGNDMKRICRTCHKKKEVKIIAFYYWRIYMCKKCENTARKRGHIK